MATIPTYDQRLDDLAAAVALAAGSDDAVVVAGYAEALDFYDWQDLAHLYELPGTATLYNDVTRRLRRAANLAAWSLPAT